MTFSSIAFLASDSPEAREAAQRLTALHGDADPSRADCVVALGGDGHMLQTLHRFLSTGIPIYGMNRGTVGFLMNEYLEDGLPERLKAAVKQVIHPLEMSATGVDGTTTIKLAINEVSLLRQSPQTAKLRIMVDGKERLAELSADGALVATPAGSTAYNLSAHGPILPIGANVMALTPISPFRPRRWRGALVSADARVEMEVLEADRRPVAASADTQEVRNVAHVVIREDRSKPMTMLFDEGHALDERILREQFSL